MINKNIIAMKNFTYLMTVMMLIPMAVVGQSTETREEIDLKDHTKKEVVKDLSTHQMNGYTIHLKDEKKQAREAVDPHGFRNIYFNNEIAEKPDGEHKYYDRVDMKENGQYAIHGLTTHQLRGERVYVPINSTDEMANQKADAINGTTPEYNNDMKDIPGVAMSETEEKQVVVYEKELRIADDSYEYTDGLEIVGSVKNEMKDGYKPITEITFFFEAKEKGLVPESMTTKEFTMLTPDEQQQIISGAGASATR